MSDLMALRNWLMVRHRGACFDRHGELRDIMFPETSGKVGGMKSTPDYHAKYDAARQVCASCSVTTECLTYALAAREGFGMWGGLDPVERLRIARRPQRKAG